MNILIFKSSDILAQDSTSIRIKITGERFKHLRHVQNFSTGDHLRFGLINGRQGIGEIISTSTESLIISGALDKVSPAPAPCKLILAMPRPIMLKRILVDVAMLGVKEIVLLGSQHVQKSYWSSKVFENNGIQQLLHRGLEQSCDTKLPKVFIEKRFKAFVEDRLLDFSSFPEIDSDIILAHPDSETVCPQPATRPFTLIVGPENGFTPYEVNLMTDNGATAFTLGERHLRVETAAIYLLGRLL